jgi:methylthioribose-1-phosphate isomerase
VRVDGTCTRSIWTEGDHVFIIDQLALPFRFEVQQLRSVDDAVEAIARMKVRGAPLIGATAAFGMALAARSDARDRALDEAAARLIATRPTAVNLLWAVGRVAERLRLCPPHERAAAGFALASDIADEDVAINRRIGEHGTEVIRRIAARSPGRPVRILTHCNAGWLATVDWGTATAPIYMAAREGIDVHVFVDETRPRLQGALTAWELAHEAIPHTVIADNTGGHLMQRGLVDMVITGTDRVTRCGDVANKIGTYQKALAARDNDVPFYVAAPTPSIDWSTDEAAAIPIEEREARELTHVRGVDDTGRETVVRILAEGTPVMNAGFDVTPARLVTSLITEHGMVPASEAGLAEIRGGSATA